MGMNLAAIRHLYPFESRWLEIGKLRYHYVDEGDGEPVLCVHGNPTWSFLFRRVVQAFSGSRRVLAVDHIGCGLSDKPAAGEYPFTFERRVEDLERFIERLDLRSVTLVLHDWGGAIGVAAALRNPERIARLVLLNTAAFPIPAGKRLPWQLRLVRNLPLLARPLVCGLNAFARGAAATAVRRPLPADVRAAFLAPYDTWHNRLATLRFVQDIPLREGDASWPLLKWTGERIDTLARWPVLICWGMHDFVFDAAILAEWHRRLPHARVVMFPDAGHYLLEDEPDAVLAEMQSFVARPGRVEPIPAGGAR